MHARVGMLRALNRHVERVFDLDRKPHHWGKRKLKSARWHELVPGVPAIRGMIHLAARWRRAAFSRT